MPLSLRNILSDDTYNEKVNNFKKTDSFRLEKDRMVKGFDKTNKIRWIYFEIKYCWKICWKKSIDLVLNKNDILMGKNKYNITNEIMDILNDQIKLNDIYI